MACGSCGTGKPNGCKSNGGCSTGGCNRLNVHDWLRNLPLGEATSDCKIVEVSFKGGSRKDFYVNTTLQNFEKGDYVTLEGVNGFDVGEVSLTGELVRLQMKKRSVKETDPEMKKILRPSQEREIELFKINKDREPSVQAKSREFARSLKLQMKLSEVEIQADGKKATFFYTADDRVDFRELIRFFANEFKLKVEMKQIGIRQEAAKVGGIGSCGRELCCSTWHTDFKSVNTTAARYQNLSINQTKLSGQCGRLKCCLNYELDTYLDALQNFPDHVDVLETARGRAFLIKKDIFKNLMWFIVEGGSKHYPLTIERVKEIKQLNQKGIRPEDLQPVELNTAKSKDIEPEYADLVGQISLKSLEKNDRKKREQQRNNQPNNRMASNQNAPKAQAAPVARKPIVNNNNNNQKNVEAAGATSPTPPQTPPIANNNNNNRPPNQNNNNNRRGNRR
jgi:cell fate regulator YaaT (PSP1 superfamily)